MLKNAISAVGKVLEMWDYAQKRARVSVACGFEYINFKVPYACN